jgi:hypothetical protein
MVVIGKKRVLDMEFVTLVGELQGALAAMVGSTSPGGTRQ